MEEGRWEMGDGRPFERRFGENEVRIIGEIKNNSSDTTTKPIRKDRYAIKSFNS